MKVALAQINTTVGAIGANVARVAETIDRAADLGAELVVFPELTLTGYPPKDLLDHDSFLTANLAALDEVAGHTRAPGRPGVIVGYVQPAEGGDGKGKHNAAALIDGGDIVSRHFKSLLPTYDVFDEARHFDPAPEVRVTDFRGRSLAISICEDFWNDELYWGRRKYPVDPIEELARQKPLYMITISASPYAAGKPEIRDRMYATATARYKIPLVHVNLVGGNDDLIFDGGSNVWGVNGRPMARAKAFEEDLICVQLEPKATGAEEFDQPRAARALLVASGEVAPSGGAATETLEPGELVDAIEGAFDIVIPEQQAEGIVSIDDARRFVDGRDKLEWNDDSLKEIVARDACKEIYGALTLGVRDYVAKCGFKRVLIGLSGGIDSALTAAVAVDALGQDSVVGVAMPSEFSSSHSVDDAAALAENLGIEHHVIAIRPVYDSFIGTLEPLFNGTPFGLAEENLQARIRGNLLMSLSNKFGWLVLTTGNKSELAVGYCTLYGDMSGGLAVLADVLKTRVYELARWVNRDAERIPAASIEKPPSAELRPDQLDTDSLPPYEELDPIIEAYIEQRRHVGEIIAAGADPEAARRICRLVDRNEYKRQQAPVCLKVTSKAFGSGRRMPIARGDWS